MLADEVKKHEPENALVAGDNGYYFYKKISREGKNYLKAGGMIAFEAGYKQAREIEEILIEDGYTNTCIYNDYNGIERVVTGIK